MPKNRWCHHLCQNVVGKFLMESEVRIGLLPVKMLSLA